MNCLICGKEIEYVAVLCVECYDSVCSCYHFVSELLGVYNCFDNVTGVGYGVYVARSDKV